MRYLLIPAFTFLLLSCVSNKPAPYSCGPVMKQKDIQETFQPILNYMELKPSDAFADVGASSGYFTVMMSTLLEYNTIYIQDIDTACLNPREFKKVVSYYSKQSNKPLETIHSFHLITGDVDKTHLPENALDKIYSNATIHVLTEPDKMMSDLYRSMKPDGSLYIRDRFADSDKKVQYCDDKKCGRPLMTVEAFLALVERNKFKLERSQVFSGYPVFKLSKIP